MSAAHDSAAPTASSSLPSSSAEFEGIIGIDLGTTFSCVAVQLNGKVEVIANDQGHRTTPSKVVCTPSGQILVGDAAAQYAGGDSVVVYDAKRMIGRDYADSDIQNDIAAWPFRIRTAQGSGKKRRAGSIEIQVRPFASGDDAYMAPEQVSALVLSYLKQTAEKFLGKKVKRAVITVPAYFNDAQREHTRLAGVLADLEVCRIVNEPTAAALAYGIDKHRGQLDSDLSVLVFDFGGGTFDVSVVQVFEQSFMVEATAGDTHLGGQDIDKVVLDHCIEEIKRAHRVDVSSDAKAVAKLRTNAEKAKRALSFDTDYTIDIEGLCASVPRFTFSISRARLDQWCASIYNRVMSIVERAVADAKKRPEDIQSVIMVGGSSRIPKLRQLLSNFFGGKAPDCSLNPDEAIAIGAAVQAAVLSTMSGQKSEHTAGIVLMDVVPLSLGVDINEGQMDVLIPRNSTIPRKVKKEYTTVEARQRVVKISIYEGERPLVKYNRLLGSFDITGITSAKKGEPTILVEMNIDANGLLSVSGNEVMPGGGTKVATAKELVVKRSDRYDEKDVERMITSAKDMAAVDAVATQLLQKRHELSAQVDQWLESAVLDESAEGFDKKRLKLLTKVEGFSAWLSNDDKLLGKEPSIATLTIAMKKMEKLFHKFQKKVAKAEKEASRRPTVVGGEDDGDDDDGPVSSGDDDEDDGSGGDEDDAESSAGGGSDSDEPPKKKRRTEKKKKSPKQ